MFESLIDFFSFILGFNGLHWHEEYEKFCRGLSHRKLLSSDATVWISCKGTFIELQREIKKFQFMYTDLHYSKTRDSKNFGRAFKAMDHHILTVTAEWRTFFRNNRLDRTSCCDAKLQDAADLTVNQWMGFQAVLYELRNAEFRPEKMSLNAIAGYIKDQFDALKYIKEYTLNN
uniref:NR LBD domain-containing protein n=1 Tax=Caenorhabditis tropicalis TaxID=1561998 RepID=A0A1I7TQ21_9PELO